MVVDYISSLVPSSVPLGSVGSTEKARERRWPKPIEPFRRRRRRPPPPFLENGERAKEK